MRIRAVTDNRSWRAGIMAALALATCGCKVLTIEEDQALRSRRSASFDASAYVKKDWGAYQANLKRASVPLDVLMPQIRRDIIQAGKAHGRQASEGAPWTFVVKGSGTVNVIETVSRTGHITLAVPTVGDVHLLSGPVIVSTALRDSLPSIRFSDFSDQMAFAALNRALNRQAMATALAAMRDIKPGDQVQFEGVTQLISPESPLEILPVRIERVPARP